MKNQLPFCPYCKQGMSYLQAWGIHKDGEYRCPRCGKTSNIRYTKRIRTFAAVASVIGFLIAVMLVIFRESIQFGHIVLVAVPFLLFFFLAPFTLVLSPVKTRRKKHIRRAGPSHAFQETAQREVPGKKEDTMVVPPVSHGDYYSSKYDFSLFEETRQMEKVKEKPSGHRKSPPVKRRVDSPKRAAGTEDEIDRILQDFIDE